MSKIKLGNRPKSFKRTITFDMLDGTKGSIQFSFKYRTRVEFGKFIDEITESAGIKQNSDEDTKFSLADLMAKTQESNSEYIMKIADGWNLDEEFSLQNVAQLCDELPGAAAATMEAYRISTTEGRLGN